MKTVKLILASLAIGISSGFAQDAELSVECRDYKMIAQDSKMVGDYVEAIKFYWKIDANCPEDSLVYKNIQYCIDNLMIKFDEDGNTDEKVVNAYKDSLLMAYKKHDDKYGSTPTEAIWYAYYLTMSGDSDYSKIDKLFTFAMGELKDETDPSFISIYYYNLLQLRNSEKDAAKKEALTRRMIDEYMTLIDMLAKIEGTDPIQEYIASVFDQVAKSCADVTPVVDKVLNNLPEDKQAKIEIIKKYRGFLDKRDCRDTKTYAQIVDLLLELDPTSEAWMAQGGKLMEQKKYNEAKNAYEKAKTFPGADNDEINYRIAHILYLQGSYKAAYNQASNVNGGEWKGKAISLMANSVAALANGCGDTTFDRKANYWYAVQLAERAGASSASFKKNCPTSQEIFNENKQQGESHYLPCWGVSVTITAY